MATTLMHLLGPKTCQGDTGGSQVCLNVCRGGGLDSSRRPVSVNIRHANNCATAGDTACCQVWPHNAPQLHTHAITSHAGGRVPGGAGVHSCVCVTNLVVWEGSLWDSIHANARRRNMRAPPHPAPPHPHPRPTHTHTHPPPHTWPMPRRLRAKTTGTPVTPAATRTWSTSRSALVVVAWDWQMSGAMITSLVRPMWRRACGGCRASGRSVSPGLTACQACMHRCTRRQDWRRNGSLTAVGSWLAHEDGSIRAGFSGPLPPTPPTSFRLQ